MKASDLIYWWDRDTLGWMQKADHKVAKGKNGQNSWDDIKAEELQTIQPFSVWPLDGIPLVLLLEGLMTESVQSSPLDLKTSPLLERFLFSRQDQRLFHGGSHPFHLPPWWGLGNYFWNTNIRPKDMLHLSDWFCLMFWLNYIGILADAFLENNLFNLCLKW